MNLRVLAAVSVVSLLASCTSSRKAVVTPSYGLSPDRSFIDLQPGWRLRVVTPLLRSGRYRISPETQAVQGTAIELRTGSDFLGYELAYYEVQSGARIRLQSVEATVDGKKESRKIPAA
ncbi:MAG: hypothetical protein H7039_02500, partial [Bryobacteraceae bacterium]|nr:hypothetical protein [Bryobacteraceae bacterium]